MDPKSELSALQERAAGLIAGAKSVGRELTDAEMAELEEGRDRAVALKAAITRGEQSAANLGSWGAGPDTGPNGAATKGYVDFSAKGVKSLAGKLAQPGIKALVAGGSTGTPVEYDKTPVPLADNSPAKGMLSFFAVKTRDAKDYTFLRQTVRTSNAAVVAPGGTKPTSLYTVAEVPNSLKVIAHMSEMVDFYLLADNSELEQFLATELGTGVIAKAESQTLADIIATSGIQTSATAAGYTPAKGFDGIYDAMTKVATAGYEPNLIALNPADYQVLRLSKDSQNRFYGGDPFEGNGNPQLWGVPTYVGTGVPAGTVLVLDRNTVEISVDRQGLLLKTDTATGFDKNQVRFLSEARFATDVKQPAGILKLTLTV